MSIRITINDLGNIHMSQSGRVKTAADQAHLRTKTRSSRSHRKVNTAIQRQISNRSLA